MNVPTNRICPFGATCEEIKDGAIQRCIGYVKMIGKDPQSEATYDEWKCSLFEWLPILLCENAQTNRGQTVAVESMRNEMVKGQQDFIALVVAASQKNKQISG